MVQGFSGFGFPKAHGAAFGLLAYQSTWLRVHYGPEFLCSLLNEQPMGFYPPDALVHEAQRRGIEVLRARRQRERGGVRDRAPTGAGARSASAMSAACASRRSRQLVAAREAGGRFRSLSDLASRAGAGAPSLELLAWSGACDSLVGGRGGVAAAVASRGGSRCGSWASRPRAGTCPAATQLALPLDLPAPPKLRELSAWEAMLADYGTTGLTVACASAGAAARPAAGGRGHQPRPRDARARHAACGSAGWSSPASVPGRPTGSCSSCSRTSTGRST